ncbi:MAG: glutathione peroxidase [Clostridia bacterium]|nr:glutathione peroxidase [Clostridia bacterium]
MSIYDIIVKTGKGEDVSLEKYKGKVLLIVNTATGCGFTPQYEGLENLYEKYNKDGLEVLDFPCNQFGNQAPGTDSEIHEFCTLKYNTKFDQFAKIDVNGENESPLFTYLKDQKGFKGFDGIKGKLLIPIVKAMDPDYKNNSNIKWNFTKFLVDKEGNVVERFESTVTPEKIEKEVKKLLGV